MNIYNEMKEKNLKYETNLLGTYHFKHPELLYNSDGVLFDYTFKDENGNEFTCSYDFYDPNSGTFIVLKTDPLNKHDNISLCAEGLATALRFARTIKTRREAFLNHSWDNNINKYKIAQSVLSGDAIKLVVVFTDNTRLTNHQNGDIKKYLNTNLNWCYSNQYWNLCA